MYATLTLQQFVEFVEIMLLPNRLPGILSLVCLILEDVGRSVGIWRRKWRGSLLEVSR
jgi:hypothetical protein